MDADYQAQGIGSDLLVDAAKRVLVAAGVIGARAIVMQALNEEAKAFYARFGFRSFSDREPLMLVLRLSELKVTLSRMNLTVEGAQVRRRHRTERKEWRYEEVV